MKIYFPQYPFLLGKGPAKLGLTPEDFIKVLDNWVTPEGLRCTEAHIAQAGAEIAALIFKAPHVFVESERLAKWLPTTLKNPQPNDAEFLQLRFRYSLGMNPKNIGQFILHVPGAEGFALLMTFTADAIVMYAPNPAIAPAAVSISEIGTRKHCMALKLILGLGMYIDTCPEALKEGFPDIAKHPNHYKGAQCVSVGASPKIWKGGTHASPEGYFKPAHDRTYKHERFINLRGHTRRIKYCWVNMDEPPGFTVTETSPFPPTDH